MYFTEIDVVRNQVLVEQGALCQYVYFIKEGEFELYLTANLDKIINNREHNINQTEQIDRHLGPMQFRKKMKTKNTVPFTNLSTKHHSLLVIGPG